MSTPEPPTTPDFWQDSGFNLLDPTEDGRLAVTEDFLRAYLLRPELAPQQESCADERALHGRLMEKPRQAVSKATILKVKDPDARDNLRVFLRFRDALVKAGTVEECYASLFGRDSIDVPPLFIDQLVHVILRGILRDVKDPMRCRAAELLFRRQRVRIEDGNIMAADADTLDMYRETGGFGDLGRLVSEAQTALREVALDVLDADNVTQYWARHSNYDTVINLSFGQYALDALARVLESWVAHFTGLTVSIQPVQQITDERWVWHIGLDADATALLNDLYQDNEVDEARMRHLLNLFRMDVADGEALIPSVAGRPIYLALCMDAGETVKLKPQNLLMNLPLNRPN